jgi:hypothetical protein
MVDPVTVFQKVCRSEGYGPRFSPIAPPASALFEILRTRASKWISLAAQKCAGLPPIFFDYVDNDFAQAFASVSDGFGLIGMFRGAVLAPHDMFHRMLSHPHVLPSLGNASAERVLPEHADGISQYFDETLTVRRAAGGSEHPTGASDPTRLAFADTLNRNAFDFLFTHELAHITHGHCEYLNSARGIPFMLELQATKGTQAIISDPLTRQAIEMDADALGVSYSLGQVLQTLSQEPRPTPFPWPEYPTLEEQALFCWCFAISGTFYLWGMNVGVDDFSDIHPPTHMRHQMARATALEVLKRQKPELLPTYLKIVTHAFFALLRSAELIGSVLTAEEQRTLAMAAVDESQSEHVGKILAQWKTIRPELMKFSRVNLAP